MDEIEQIKERLNIEEVISSYLTLKKAGSNLKAPCPFHNEKTPSFMVSPERQTFKCFGCFPKGELVQTESGLKEIQKIKKGEKVYSSKGKLRKVNLAFKRKYEGDLLEIIPRMICAPVKITGDHKVFAIRTKNCKQNARLSRLCQNKCKQNCPDKYFQKYKVEKIEARKLTVNDYLLYPLKSNYTKCPNVNVFDYINIKPKRGKKPRQFKNNIKIDDDFIRLAGLYISEGSSHRAYIRFSYGPKEDHFAQETVRLISNVFGLKASIHVRGRGKTGIEVTCCNSLLAQSFKTIFGAKAWEKKIPFFLLGLDKRHSQVLVNAFIDGDGTVLRPQKNNKGGRFSVTTTSLELVHQMKDVLLSLGQRPSLNYAESYQSTDGVNHRKSYKINWRKDDNSHFSDFYIHENVTYWIIPIRSIKKTDFIGHVYNLNVAIDHSYLTKSFSVGNCGEGGDVFTFIEKIEGVDFYNALLILADRAGVKLKPKEGIKYGDKEYQPDQKTKLFEINDWAARVYHEILIRHPKASKARAYLKDRGLSDETIKKFQIGYAPESWDFIIKFLLKKGYSENEMFKAGLLAKGERGGHYDRFRGRIMFPISNVMGNVVAFTSRVLKDDGVGAKYLNSADSSIYHKGKILYGLNLAKMSIKSCDLAIMVEGNMDVIATHQAGFLNVVAASGTAATADQFKILSRYTSEIALCFDSDEAGEVAMKRSIRLALENDINVKIVALPRAFKDPDEAIVADRKNWERAVNEAKPALEHWIDLLIRKSPTLSVSEKKKIAKEILPVIKSTFSEIEKEHYVHYLAGKLSVSENSLKDSMQKQKADNKQKPTDFKQKEIKLSSLERIVGIIWSDLSLVSEIKKNIETKSEKKEVEKIVDLINSGKLDKKEFSPDEQNELNQISLMAMKDFEVSNKDSLKEELIFLVKRTEGDGREGIKKDFARKIADAEKAGDKKKIKKLVEEFQGLIK